MDTEVLEKIKSASSVGKFSRKFVKNKIECVDAEIFWKALIKKKVKVVRTNKNRIKKK